MTEMTKRGITSTVLGLFTWIALDYMPPIVFFLFLCFALLEILACEWPRFYKANPMLFWLTPLYPILPFGLMLALCINPNPSYQQLLFVMLVLVSSHDSGAFMVGSKYGKHRLAPSISPSKTWEGFFGGCAMALFIMYIVMFMRTTPHASWPVIIAITLLTCVLATIGDLFESVLKRSANLKDAGTILPGHGGFLDRFDGIIFAAIIFYIFRDTLCIMLGA
jgi:phosphatidate cytidylyltransferase